ncbi:MAG: hypothetical protein ACI9CF_001739 [Candidatus Omnitrophota bacterium]|jgi:hypothetical protein
MDLQIDSNPNCEEIGHVVFNTVDDAKSIDGLITNGPDGDRVCDVIGVDLDGQFIEAQAQKINDSGEGLAYLISGGAWGIRLRPKEFVAEDWDLSNSHQWGEAFKVYGAAKDILYKSKIA